MILLFLLTITTSYTHKITDCFLVRTCSVSESIFKAIENKNVALLNTIYKKGLFDKYKIKSTVEGKTPLMAALETRDYLVIKAVLNFDKNFEAVDIYGNNFIYYVITNQCNEFLLDIDNYVQDWYKFLTVKNFQGKMPIDIAKEVNSPFYTYLLKVTLIGLVLNKDKLLLTELKNRGLDLDASIEGDNLITTFIKRNDLLSLRFLLEDMNLSFEKINNFGRTPLVVAVDESFYEAVEYLIKRGANLKAKIIPTGETALDIATKKDDQRMITIILKSTMPFT